MERLHGAIVASIERTTEKHHINQQKAEAIISTISLDKEVAASNEEYELGIILMLRSLVKEKEISLYTVNCIRCELSRMFSSVEYTRFMEGMKVLAKDTGLIEKRKR